MPRALVALLLVCMLAACVTGCGASLPPAPQAIPLALRAEPEIITPDEGATRRELAERAQRAIREGRWRDAAQALETLRAAGRFDGDPGASGILFNLGVAYEGMGERERARDVYAELVKTRPDSAEARPGLLRLMSIHADLEEWAPLGEAAESLLGHKDLDTVDRMSALGARGLSRVEQGDDVGAMHDIQLGLDDVEALGFGTSGKMPSPAAQLRFAQAEVRRVRSERIGFVPVTPDFLLKIGARCQGLLDAQNAYADTMRSEDPHWAAMSGYHVGAMYRALHHDLVSIPPTALAKTDSDKRLFFAMMHLRYRVLLEKGLEMMKRTTAFGSKNPEVLPWAKRADQARAEIEQDLVDEKAIMASFPYTEEVLQKALDLLEKKALAKAAKASAASP
jgi:tetratricopeptide (TPR) repeat protein